MMNRNMTTRLAGLLCAATLLATPPALRAQSADSTKAATMAVPAASPTGIDIQMSDIVAAPSNEELKQTKDEAKRLEESSATDLSAAKEREARYRSKADIRKSEIDATKSRIELAKKDKNKEAQSTLEATKKRQELEQQLYQKMAEMEKTKGQAADAARLYARARQNSCDILADLSAKYYQRQSLLGGGAPEKLVQMERQVRETEKKALEVLKDVASRQNDWTNKQKDLVDRRMDAFNALSALLAL